MRFFIGCMGCLALSVAFYLVWVTGIFDTSDSLPRITKEPNSNLSTYLSFVSIMMTAVTVVLAAFAITIGVISFYTIKEIKEKAIKMATKTATDVASKTATETATDVATKHSTEIATDVATKHAEKTLHPDNIEKLLFESILGMGKKKETDDKKNNSS